MKTIDAIYKRRSVKHYDPNFIIPAQDEKTLKGLIRQAPTSFNLQNYRVVIVKDTGQRTKLQEAAWGQAQIKDASLLFVLTADLKAWDKNPARYWSDASKEAQDILIPKIQPFYDGKDWQQRDEAMRSIGIVAQTLMLGATALGYDSCPMIGFDSEKVGKIIDLPNDHIVGMMVVVGKRAKDPWPKPGFLDNDEIFKEDRF